MHLKISSAKWRPFCPGENELKCRRHVTWFACICVTCADLRLMSIAFGRFSVHVLWCIQSHPYLHDDVIRWTHFPGYWPIVRELPVTGEFPHNGQWRGALMLSLICACINSWANNGYVGVLRRHRAHYCFTTLPRTPQMCFCAFTSSHIVCSVWRMCSKHWDENKMKIIKTNFWGLDLGLFE